MLIIGHRGAAGVARENTIESLQAGLDAEADVLEFDVHATKDNVPILVHDGNLRRTHKTRVSVGQSTLKQLQKVAAKTDYPIATLEEVLDNFFGKIILNIEIKQRGCAKHVIKLLKKKYIKKDSDWNLVVFSSFFTNELKVIRKLSGQANLWLLHNRNPFIFIAYARRLGLNGVGFHRLYVNDFALEIAKKTELFTYAYTVNRPHSAYLLSRKGIDGVVTDRPKTILDDINRRQS